jgi:CHAD domain-containing protein
LRSLHRELRARLERSLDKVRNAVESERFRALSLQTALWLTNGAWSRGDDPPARAQCDREAAEFAADMLARRTRRILKNVHRVANMEPDRRHKLRISVKKLRYGSDFFASLFDDKEQISRRKTFEKTLKSLQASLGALNDITMQRRLAKSVVHDGAGANRSEQAFAMGFVTGVERKQIERCFRDAEKSGRELAAAAPFWE